MSEFADLRSGQAVEWYDTGFGGCVSGAVEYVSRSTGWVTVKLKEPYTLRPSSNGSDATKTDRVTHTTLRGTWLAPRG